MKTFLRETFFVLDGLFGRLTIPLAVIALLALAIDGEKIAKGGYPAVAGLLQPAAIAVLVLLALHWINVWRILRR